MYVDICRIKWLPIRGNIGEGQSQYSIVVPDTNTAPTETKVSYHQLRVIVITSSYLIIFMNIYYYYTSQLID
jgi:hypothetical protein